MARAEDQARWRRRSNRRRIEVSLPVDIANRLDRLAEYYEEDRTHLLARIIENHTPGQSTEEEGAASRQDGSIESVETTNRTSPDTATPTNPWLVVRWQRVASGWDALDALGRRLAYCVRLGRGWQAEAIALDMPKRYGYGRTRNSALEDLYR